MSGLSPGRRGPQIEEARLRGKCSEGGRSQIRFSVIYVLFASIIKTTPGASRGCCNRAETPRGDSRKTGQFRRPMWIREVGQTAGPAWKRPAGGLKMGIAHVYNMSGSADTGPSGVAADPGAAESSHREPAPHAILDRFCS